MKFPLLLTTLTLASLTLTGCGTPNSNTNTTSTAINSTNTTNQSTVNTETNTNTTQTTPASNTNSQTPSTSSTTNTNTSAPTTPEPTVVKDDGTTLADVATHANSSDCWLVIEGAVYDVTAYIPQHPGGSRILQGCGKDATDLFTGRSTIGRVHSAVARNALKKYKIADLAK